MAALESDWWSFSAKRAVHSSRGWTRVRGQCGMLRLWICSGWCSALASCRKVCWSFGARLLPAPCVLLGAGWWLGAIRSVSCWLLGRCVPCRCAFVGPWCVSCSWLLCWSPWSHSHPGRVDSGIGPKRLGFAWTTILLCVCWRSTSTRMAESDYPCFKSSRANHARYIWSICCSFSQVSLRADIALWTD